MPHVLDGCYLKLDRAAEHLDAFDREAQEFLAQRPFTVTPEVNREGTRRSFYFEPTEDPPPRLGAIVGDCVANLRATLDRLAFQLSHQGAKHSANDVGFPIFTSEREFRDPLRGQRMMRDVRNPRARALIEEMQPFQRPSDVRASHPLAVLNKLATIDRYRLLPLARPYVVAVRLESGQSERRVHAKPFGRRTVLATLPAAAEAPPDIAPHLVLGFTADDIPYTGESAARVLRWCANAVHDVLFEAERRGIVPLRG